MARTQTQIETQLAADIAAVDPGVDTTKGPIPDIYIRPQAVQFRQVEILYDDLSRRYSLDYILTRNTAALDLYGANHGLRRDMGRSAIGNVTFFTYTRPTSSENVTIPAGTVIGTSNRALTFQTTRDATFFGSRIDSFYNAARRRYEISIPVESLGTGPDFELPPFRIVAILAPVAGVDGVEQRARLSGGTNPESNVSFGRRIRAKFNGTALGSGDGLNQLVRNYDTSRIRDVALVFSSDYVLFRRFTRRAAWDVYLIGESAADQVDVFVGDGVTTAFTLTLPPVLNVSAVTVNNVSSAFTFAPDTTDAYKQSTRAADKIILPAAPAIGIEVRVTYQYDKLVRDTQTYVNRIAIQLYRADTLLRKALQTPLKINVLITVLSSFDEIQAVTDTFAQVASFGNPNRFVGILFPNDLRSQISANVGGVSQVTIVEFTKRDTGLLPIEAVEFLSNEYPICLDADITVNARI